jgi:hypothetical protein
MQLDRPIRLLRCAASVFLLALTALACAVTTEDIDTWMGTVRGPGKIVAVLLADKYSDELRIHAGLALVRMERSDVDGISELQAALRRLDADTRRRIVDGMTPGLLALMRGEGQPHTEGGPPPPLEVRAKDASFLVLQYASPEQQHQLTRGVVGWFVADFNGRSLAGNFSAEQIVRQLGAPAATQLVDAMSARIPQEALVKIAELIAALGDDATKQRAGQRLVEIEREMESPEFERWLTERVRQQLQREGQAVDEARVAMAVRVNREQFILQGALPAMHHLASQPMVAARLLEIAMDTTTPGQPGEDRRVAALQALEGHVRPEQVQPLVQLALNPQTPVRVRDYAFDRIADSRDRSVIPQLWPAATSPDSAGNRWRLRWRVGSLILTLGGRDVVQEWLNRLPATRDVAYAREELHGYADRLAAMRPVPTEIMTQQLGSTDWWDRAIALYYFERNGTEADLPRIQALTTDPTPTRGEHWEEHNTIGKIAQDVVTAIRERVSTGASGSGGGGAAPRSAGGEAAPAGGSTAGAGGGTSG